MEDTSSHAPSETDYVNRALHLKEALERQCAAEQAHSQQYAKNPNHDDKESDSDELFSSDDEGEPELPPNTATASATMSDSNGKDHAPESRYHPNDPRFRAPDPVQSSTSSPPSAHNSQPPIRTNDPRPHVDISSTSPIPSSDAAVVAAPDPAVSSNSSEQHESVTPIAVVSSSDGIAEETVKMESPSSSPRVDPSNVKKEEVVDMEVCGSCSAENQLLPNDVVHIEDVEWASPEEMEGAGGEKAPRPKYDRNSDPCGCWPEVGERCCVDMSCVLFACQEECRSNCEAGDYCGNKRIQRKEWKQLQVFDAGVKGRGLRAVESIQKDEFITEYVGVAVKKDYLDNLFRRYKNERMLYIMALDHNVYLDARKRGGIARYVNHSCEPNCVVHRWRVRGISRACIFALREIAAGEELSFDYQWTRKRGRAPTKCHCKSTSCRGTLELEKVTTLEEEELEMLLSGHWKKPGTYKAGHEIVNRCVKVYFEGNSEWYAADVCKYDEKTGQHLLIYKQELEEHWEDLAKEQWMLLDEECEQYVIGKKVNRGPSWMEPVLGSSDTTTTDPPSSSQPQSQQLQQQRKQPKNYIFVQTPMKEELTRKRLFDKCQRHFRVQIFTLQCVKANQQTISNTEEDNEEAMDEIQALEASKDGFSWKLTITGMNPFKAKEFLEQNIDIVERELNCASSGGMGGGGDDSIPLEITLGGGKLSSQDLSGSAVSSLIRQEMIIPRSVVDQFKKRVDYIRGHCRNVTLTFGHSKSKSKRFAKINLSATVDQDMRRAEEVLWDEVTKLCHVAQASLTDAGGYYKDLGFFGGELTCDQYQMLFQNASTRSGNHHHKALLTQDCNENLRSSTFVSSFEDSQNCVIWVQSADDMGRIDSQNNIVNEASGNDPRKIYFGCNPSRIPKLWNVLQMRAVELGQGVKYLYLGSDRIYQPVLLQKCNRKGTNGEDFFFNYVQKSTGVRVAVDTLTRNHLRLDAAAGETGNKPILSEGDLSLDDRSDVEKRLALAEEIIHLQIELFRDHFILQQRWGFGRDWTLIDMQTKPTKVPVDALNRSVSTTRHSSAAVGTIFESRAVASACLEIADIVSSLKLDSSVGAHACVILYRLMIQVSQSEPRPRIHHKLRDFLVSCLFLANKAQKIVKWKRLEVVIEAAYRTFYPAGSNFVPGSAEAANWEKRTLEAETFILTTLDYDVFWPGMGWIMAAATGDGGIAEPLARNAMELALSGPVLAAGPTLWLKYGPEYAFAAMAGFISANLDNLFSALSLIPLKVSDAAELIANSVEVNSNFKKLASHRNHELLVDGKKTLLNNVPIIQQVCRQHMSAPQQSSLGSSPLAKNFEIIARRDRRRRVFQGIDSGLLKSRILPVLDGICVESKCRIYLEASASEGCDDIVIEGNWRALAIAEHLLKISVVGPTITSCPDESATDDANELGPFVSPVSEDQSASSHAGSASTENGTVTSEVPSALSDALVATVGQNRLPPSSDAQFWNVGLVKMQSKQKPGLLSMSAVCTTEGWKNTIQSAAREQLHSRKRLVGSKTCVAAKIPESALQKAGLRWWVPPRHGSSMSGSLCDRFAVRQNFGADESTQFAALGRLSRGMIESSSSEARPEKSFSLLQSNIPDKERDLANTDDRVVAVSIQRWPPEKVESRERSKKSSTEKSTSMEMGFSASALQELQLLNHLHFLIPAPQGHPNFVLPVAVALPDAEDEEILDTIKSKTESNGIVASDDIFSLFQSSEENERKAKKQQQSKESAKGPHLVFNPTPLVMQKLTMKTRRRGDEIDHGSLVTPALIASWFHDLLSAVAHCHCNHIVVRSFQPDQICIDQSGVVKMSGFFKATMLSTKERGKFLDPLKSARSNKKGSTGDDDASNSPYIAPELLLGSTVSTHESDMWSLGCLMAHLLVGKQLFIGRDKAARLYAMYKIVGAPSSENYPQAVKYPNYEKPLKKYKPGVTKALRFMMKDWEVEKDQYSGALDLLECMLQLDPEKRITVSDALEHDFMKQHVTNTKSNAFCERYVKEWLKLKEKLMIDEEAIDVVKDEKKRGRMDREVKRKAWLMEASASGADDYDDDDLYNLDDLLGKGIHSGIKKAKES